MDPGPFHAQFACEAQGSAPESPREASSPNPQEFPRAAEWVELANAAMEAGGSILPTPLPSRPGLSSTSRSSRIRSRRRRAMGIWRSSTRALMVLNSLVQV